jgi:hypothetical protein
VNDILCATHIVPNKTWRAELGVENNFLIGEGDILGGSDLGRERVNLGCVNG